MTDEEKKHLPIDNNSEVDELSPDFSANIVREKLKIEKDKAEHKMDSQSYFLKFVVITFGITNFVVLLAIGYFYNCDAYMLAEKLITPADRLITTNVVMSLIGATAVQLGAVLFTAAKYLFEKSP